MLKLNVMLKLNPYAKTAKRVLKFNCEASSEPSVSRDLYSAIEKSLKASPVAELFPPLPPTVSTSSRSCSLRVSVPYVLAATPP
ncbi:hypothetical protein Bca4012_004711 [Brassica carinata]